MTGKISKKRQLSKPTSMVGQLRALKIGQTRYCPAEAAKVDTVRQAAQRLKAEGIIIKVSVRGLAEGCMVTRYPNEQRETES